MGPLHAKHHCADEYVSQVFVRPSGAPHLFCDIDTAIRGLRSASPNLLFSASAMKYDIPKLSSDGGKWQSWFMLFMSFLQVTAKPAHAAASGENASATAHKDNSFEVYSKAHDKHLFTASMNDNKLFPAGIIVDMRQHTGDAHPELPVSMG